MKGMRVPGYGGGPGAAGVGGVPGVAGGGRGEGGWDGAAGGGRERTMPGLIVYARYYDEDS